MKKIIVSIFFMSSFFLFSESINLNGSYIKNKIEKDENDRKLNLFFDAIRKGDNQYVYSHLREYRMEEIKKRQEELEQSDESEIRRAGPYLREFNDDIKDDGTKRMEFYLVSVNEKNSQGYTPLIVAIESKNNEIVELLMEKDADLKITHPVFGRLSLHTACYYENEEAVKMIIEKDKTLVNSKSGVDGWLPLQDAVLKNNEEIVKILLENGANPNLTDYKGGTAMDMAVKFGKGKLVKLIRDDIKNKRR